MSYQEDAQAEMYAAATPKPELEPEKQPKSCYCPDDCNCRKPWRTSYCGCRAHDDAR